MIGLKKINDNTEKGIIVGQLNQYPRNTRKTAVRIVIIIMSIEYQYFVDTETDAFIRLPKNETVYNPDILIIEAYHLGSWVYCYTISREAFMSDVHQEVLVELSKEEAFLKCL